MVLQDKYYYSGIQSLISNLMNAIKQKDQRTIRYYSVFKNECDTFLFHTKSLPVMTDVMLFYYTKYFTNQIFKGPYGAVYRFDNLSQSYQKIDVKCDFTSTISSTLFEYINQGEILYLQNKSDIPIHVQSALFIVFDILKIASRNIPTIKSYINHLYSSLFKSDSKYVPQISVGEITYENNVLQVVRNDKITSLNYFPRKKSYYDFQLNDKSYPIFKKDFTQEDIDNVKEYLKTLFPFPEVQQKLFIKTLIKLVQCGLFNQKVKYIAY